MRRRLPHTLALLVFYAVALPAWAQDEQAPAPLGPIEQKRTDLLALPGDAHRLVPDTGGGLLLLSGDRLALLGKDGITIKREVGLPRVYSDIAARGGYLVAVSKQDKMVELIDRKTFKAFWSKQTPHPPARIEPHPELPVSYIPLDDRDRTFLVFDEQGRKLRANEGWIGQGLRVDPRGQFMLAGMSQAVQVGTRLEHLGRHLHEVPVYKTINIMARYHLDEGRPYISNFREGVGGGFEGIRLSPDGLGVVFLSRTGYPQGSGNLAIWESLDFEALPNALAVKEGGSSRDLAFHPVLPIAATPGEKAALFFNAKTGEAEPTRLTDADKLPEGLKTDAVAFSPDGMNVLLGGVVDGKRVLVASPMRLSLTEELWIEQGPPKLEPVKLPEIDLPDPDHNPYAYEEMAKATDQWYRANCIPGVETRLYQDLMKHAGGLLDKKQGYTVLFGGGLVKSGKPTVIGVHSGVFLSTELTDKQAQTLGLGKNNMSVWPGAKYDEDQAFRPVRLGKPSITQFKGDRMWCKAEVLKNGDLNEGLFGMTLTYRKDDSIVTSIYHGDNWMENEGEDLEFIFDKPGKDADKPRLFIGYVEMIAFTVSRRHPNRVTLSEPVMLVIETEPTE